MGTLNSVINIRCIVDTVPISRNENLVGFMHKCGICEERGSGYDKVIHATSKNLLHANLLFICNWRGD